METGLDKENGLEFPKPPVKIYGKKDFKNIVSRSFCFSTFNFSAGMPFLYSRFLKLPHKKNVR
jgi:hypothetical protein